MLNMAGVDLNRYRFDYDLTFAILLMNADGTIYHTYGGRTWEDPLSHLSVDALVRVMNDTLPEHEAYQEAPRPPKKQTTQTIEQIPPMADRIARGKRPDCFHCHMVNDARTAHRRDAGRWSEKDIWIWPDPIQAGLALDRDDQVLVTEVEARSAAAAAGLRAGDRIVKLGGTRVRTFGDVQRVLDEAPYGATTLAVALERGGLDASRSLRLSKGWKVATPLVFSWRPSKWPLSPKPGFGGPALTAAQREAHGIPQDRFAFRVGYIVDWGENAHTGRNARQAGLRKGDIVTSVAGKNDFHGMDHFHAWFRLTQRAGQKIQVRLLRNGKPETITLKVVD